MTEEGGGCSEQKEVDYCAGISLDIMRFLSIVYTFKSS